MDTHLSCYLVTVVLLFCKCLKIKLEVQLNFKIRAAKFAFVKTVLYST